MDNEIQGKSNNLWVKVLIVILILVMVAGIYIFKRVDQNNQDEKSIALEISSVDLDEITSYGLPYVIDFGSDSCIPCKEMAPVLEILHKEWQGKAIVHFVDVWKNADAARDFPISVIPTQIFYNADGTPFYPSEELAGELEFTLYSNNDTKEHVVTVHQGGITEDQMRKIFAEMGVE